MSDYYEQTGATAKLVNGSPSWAAPYTKENGLAWNLESEDKNTKDIKMPRIRFSDFNNVQFYLKMNGNLDKTFSLGINSVGNLTDYSEYSNILIDITNTNNEKHTITAINLDNPLEKTTYIYTEPAIDGTENLVFIADGLDPDIII